MRPLGNPGTYPGYTPDDYILLHSSPIGQEHSVPSASSPPVLLPQGTQEEPSENAALEGPEHELHVNPVSRSKKRVRAAVVKNMSGRRSEVHVSHSRVKTLNPNPIPTCRIDTSVECDTPCVCLFKAKLEDPRTGCTSALGRKNEQAQ